MLDKTLLKTGHKLVSNVGENYGNDNLQKLLISKSLSLVSWNYCTTLSTIPPVMANKTSTIGPS